MFAVTAAHVAHGNACGARGALDEAAAAFESALALQPGSLAALYGLGNVRLRQQRYRDAVRCFETIARVHAGFPGLAYHLGVAQQGLGDERAAAAAFRAALRDEPHRLPALNNLCVALLRCGEAEHALVACERYLACSPPSRKALAYKAAALVALGRRDAARELLDFDRLILEREIAPPPGLAAAILAHPSLRREPAGKSTRGGRQTGELGTAMLGALGDAIRAGVSAYVEHLQGHPYAAHLPARWRLATWAVVLDAQGYQSPHFHPAGHISGVYYVGVPRDPGALEFGDTREALGDHGEPILHLVRPRAGLLVMFPSYFYHRTLPFEASEQRISVAFDVLAVE